MGVGWEGENWGSPEEGQSLGSLQGSGASGEGGGGPGVLRKKALCPTSMLPWTQHRCGAVIRWQCLCAGGETQLDQSCRFQRLVSELRQKPRRPAGSSPSPKMWMDM